MNAYCEGVEGAKKKTPEWTDDWPSKDVSDMVKIPTRVRFDDLYPKVTHPLPYVLRIEDQTPSTAATLDSRARRW